MVSEGKKIFRIKLPGAYFWTEKQKPKTYFPKIRPGRIFTSENSGNWQMQDLIKLITKRHNQNQMSSKGSLKTLMENISSNNFFMKNLLFAVFVTWMQEN